MTAYCFFDVLEFTDPAKIEKYRAGAAATVAQYGGRYLIAGGKCDVVEGTWRPTYPVMLEFPSLEQAHRAVFDGIRIASGSGDRTSRGTWVSEVTEAAPSAVAALISELAVATLPTRMDSMTGLPSSRYVEELFDRVRTVSLTRRVADAMSEMRRLDHAQEADPERSRVLATELQDLQRQLARIKEGMS